MADEEKPASGEGAYDSETEFIVSPVYVGASKDDTVAVLIGIRSAFLYGMVLDSGADVDAMCDRMKEKSQFGFERRDGTVGAASLNEVRVLLSIPGGRDSVRENLKLYLRHGLIHRTHEMITMYCDKTGQFKKYQAAPWFQFARLFRNILSHHDGSTLNEWNKTYGPSVTWRHWTLTPSDVGRAMYLDSWETFQLHYDMCEFLVKELA